ncbi:tRNA (cytidine(34)-2'-O)-methyltransferase [Robiginitomaculum antarcticum]|uniref:tRNA (cytidine(34)-2'-O)-methyltransferase n=1 Tax=Robiginitomaculum antarcticum TaxID=437507 RepID=UPI000364F853|nr:TrmH family RNA methyltransferase [Robiginitomaculum antarcticum]
MRLILFQPDQPGNFGAAIRLCACFGLSLEVVLPCGFPLTAKAARRAAMDYGHTGDIIRHANLNAAMKSLGGARLILLTTQGAQDINSFEFCANDALIFGRESEGAPDLLHGAADARVRIPMSGGARSLNLVNSASITLFEALRQTGGLPVEALRQTASLPG